MSDDNFVSTGASAHRLRPGRGLRHWFDSALLKALEATLRQTPAGRLHLTLPSGLSAVVGPPVLGVEASLTLNNYGMLRKSMRRGLLGFADSYMAGDFDTTNLCDLFDYYIDNEIALEAARPGLLRAGRGDHSFHLSRGNTRSGSRRNISAHYDLGNEFYRLWLDREMIYSSAYFARPDMSLEEAQTAKVALILDALELNTGQSVLEIGCGWGGLALAIARRGAAVTGITISEQQYQAATSRVLEAGLQDKARIQFEDYRDTKGTFDRLVSIEMIEAVGEEHWPAYFKTIADRLKPGGLGVVQAITIRPDLFDIYRRKPDFIQRYIFPGGMLPTFDVMAAQARAAGLSFETIETFAGSYERTLTEWRIRFVEAWPRIEALGFDRRFRRMWEYYLCYCETGFKRGTIDVGLYRLRKPQ